MKKYLCTALIAILLAVSCTCAQAGQMAQLTLTTDISEGYGADIVTLSLKMSAQNLGGMQTTIRWNDGYLTYVEDSAEFADAFAADAMMCMINDSTPGSLRLVYGNVSGYNADNETVFTAKFRLNDNTSGNTVFSFADTKLTDASAELSTIQCETAGATVRTQVYNPGSVSLRLERDVYRPTYGDVVTVTMKVTPSGAEVGSLQGTITYDPAVFEYVADSAVFSEDAEKAAFIHLINSNEAGALKFVYGSLTGCPEGVFLTVKFKVIGEKNTYSYVRLADAKATNTETDRLSQMTCSTSYASFNIQQRLNMIKYTARIEETGVHNGASVVLRISADGVDVGGLQATVSYNPEQLEYMKGTATLTDAFTDAASICMVNDATSGKIRLVYLNTDGYTPDGADIFTAEFVVKTCDTELDPITMDGIKTTNASAEELKEIDSIFVQGISWPTVLAGHKFVPVAGKEPTCTEPGLTEGVQCAACGEVKEAQTEIPAKGHTEETIPAVPPTLEAPGYTEGVKCSVCDTILVEPAEIPMLRKVTVTIDSKTMAFGEALPEFTYTTDVEIPEGALHVIFDTIDVTGCGNYAITATVEADAMYVVTVVPGILTVEGKTIVFVDRGKTLLLQDMIYGTQYLAFENVDLAIEEILAGGGMEIKMKDGSIYTAGLTYSGTYQGYEEYKAVTEGIPAKEMGDMLFFRPYLTVNGEKIYAEGWEWSVRTYCEGRFENSTNELLKAAMAALLNYGAEAQIYKKYDMSNLMNANLQSFVEKGKLKAEYLALNWDNNYLDAVLQPSEEMQANFKRTDTVTNNGTTLLMEGAISLKIYLGVGYAGEKFENATDARIYFWTAKDYAELEAKGEALSKENASYTITPDLEYSNYGYEYTSTSHTYKPKQYGETMYTVLCVTDADGIAHCSGVIADSPEGYAGRKVNDGKNAQIDNVMRWMVVYGERVKSYKP